MYGKRKRIAAGASSVLSRINRGKRAARKPARRAAKRPRLAVRTKQRFKGRGGRTRTATATIATEATGNTHSGLNTQTLRVGNWKKPKANTVGKWRYQQTYRYNLFSGAGLQAVSTLVVPLHYLKIFNSTGPGYVSYQNYTALEALNPYVTPTTTVVNYGPTQIPQNDRFIVNYVNLQVELTNFSAVGCFMDVYIVECKKPTSEDAVAIWSRGLAFQALGQPQMQQPLGASNTVAQGTGGQGYPLVNAVDNHPRESKLFGEFYKTHKVKRLMMTGGSTETLNIDIGINKVIKCEMLRELGQYGSAGYIAGLTWQVFVVQRGALVEDEAAGAGANPHLPTYGDTKIGCIIQEKYVLCGVMGNTTRLDTSTEYSNIPYGTSLANQDILNVVDQVVSVATDYIP